MIERRIVRRYASALFRAASRAGLVDRIESDLGLVSYALETSPGLMAAIHSPLTPLAVKREIVGDVFAGKIDEITISYLNLLVRKRREEAISPTEHEYILLADEARGIVNAEVTTAVKLTEDEEARIRERLSKMTGKSVHTTGVVAPEIIGGVLVKIGDTVIDGSIRGRLVALKERLLS